MTIDDQPSLTSGAPDGRPDVPGRVGLGLIRRVGKPGPVRRYRIQHSTRYTYSDTVSASYGRGYLRPRELAWQNCSEHVLRIEPRPSDTAESTDVYGNADCYFHVTDGHTSLVVTGVSTVQVGRPPIDESAADAPWEQARVAGADDPLAMDFVVRSPLVEINDEVRAYAAGSFPPGRGMRQAVGELAHRIFADFSYKSGSTTVSTPIPEVMRAREGVCQDFAHVGVACLRSLGLAARYVSGYLATDPPPGRPRMIGVDASHAWLAVRLVDGSWLAVDPTNDQEVDERYTTVAWGRDYSDVPPLRGVIFTDATTSKMKVSVDVAPLS